MFPKAPLPVGPLLLGGGGIVALGVGATFVAASGLEDDGRRSPDATANWSYGPLRNPVMTFSTKPDGGPW